MKKLFLFTFLVGLTFQISSQTVVSGDVTGIWDTDGSPYWVNGDINVVDSLIILPGVLVQFEAGGLRIEVGGNDKFIAAGTLEAPIIFEPKIGTNPGSWDRIYIVNSGDDDTLSYCSVRFAQIGIHSKKSSSFIYGCEVYGCSDRGLFFDDGGNGKCQACIIHNNNNGIDIFSNDNDINIQVYKCFVYSNFEIGIYIYNGWPGHVYSEIVNSTIINNNSHGIKAYKGSATTGVDAFISNSIIAYNEGYGITNENGATLGINDVIHNCFWSNTNGDIEGISGTGFGQTGPYFNNNGDSCDISQNIYYDPLFSDTANADFSLLEGSKCIDAGTNIIFGQIVYDPDNTMPDIGAHYFDQTGVGFSNMINGQEEKKSITIYPNPVHQKATIAFDNPEHLEYTLIFYDFSGKRVWEMKQITNFPIELTRGALPAGVYLIELKGEKVFREKMIIK